MSRGTRKMTPGVRDTRQRQPERHEMEKDSGGPLNCEQLES